MADVPQRLEAIREQLDAAAAEYTQAKDEFERARVRYETTREKFAGVKRLASEMLTRLDWVAWEMRHPRVKYAAMTIGDAILGLLRRHAFYTALNYNQRQVPDYSPDMGLEGITQELESGGFDFRSVTPLREVNAALINLAGIKKSPRNTYAVADAGEILEYIEKTEGEERKP